MSLEELRKKIDEAEMKIVQLIAERIRIAEEIGGIKKRQGKQIEDTAREQVVLDNITEIAVMEAINNLVGCKTIIMIAHRLTTVKACDVIYMIEKGKIIARGDYDTLLHTSAEFQQMVNVG